jgi:hypothetical protein
MNRLFHASLLSGALLVLPLGSSVEAADLVIGPPSAGRIVHHGRPSLVRDYDGTPITVRPRLDGTRDAYEAPRAQPRYYLNGEPVGARYLIR